MPASSSALRVVTRPVNQAVQRVNQTVQSGPLESNDVDTLVKWSSMLEPPVNHAVRVQSVIVHNDQIEFPLVHKLMDNVAEGLAVNKVLKGVTGAFNFAISNPIDGLKSVIKHIKDNSVEKGANGYQMLMFVQRLVTSLLDVYFEIIGVFNKSVYENVGVFAVGTVNQAQSKLWETVNSHSTYNSTDAKLDAICAAINFKSMTLLKEREYTSAESFQADNTALVLAIKALAMTVARVVKKALSKFQNAVNRVLLTKDKTPQEKKEGEETASFLPKGMMLPTPPSAPRPATMGGRSRSVMRTRMRN
ncbi:hypothetical protein V8C86DRAFT_3170082 [Haematococcus lacustris]